MIARLIALFRRPDAQSASVPSYANAYDSGYADGVLAERLRHRTLRSAAGTKAAATKRNRITGEQRPAIDGGEGAE